MNDINEILSRLDGNSFYSDHREKFDKSLAFNVAPRRMFAYYDPDPDYGPIDFFKPVTIEVPDDCTLLEMSDVLPKKYLTKCMVIIIDDVKKNQPPCMLGIEAVKTIASIATYATDDELEHGEFPAIDDETLFVCLDAYGTDIEHYNIEGTTLLYSNHETINGINAFYAPDTLSFNERGFPSWNGNIPTALKKMMDENAKAQVASDSLRITRNIMNALLFHSIRSTVQTHSKHNAKIASTRIKAYDNTWLKIDVDTLSAMTEIMSFGKVSKDIERSASSYISYLERKEQYTPSRIRKMLNQISFKYYLDTYDTEQKTNGYYVNMVKMVTDVWSAFCSSSKTHADTENRYEILSDIDGFMSYDENNDEQNDISEFESGSHDTYTIDLAKLKRAVDICDQQYAISARIDAYLLGMPLSDIMMI